MRVDWGNSERTRAIITVGWLRKRSALVEDNNTDGLCWFFTATGRPVAWNLGNELRRLRAKAVEADHLAREWVSDVVPAARKVLR